MKRSIKLAHKGWLLVSVPLLFYLSFMAILINMLDQVERESNREAHSKEVFATEQGCSRLILGWSALLAETALTSGPKQIDRCKLLNDQLSQEIQQLEQLVSGDAEQLSCVKVMKHSKERAAELMQLFFASNWSESEEGTSLLSSIVQSRAPEIVAKFQRAADRVRELEMKHTLSNEPSAKQWRELVKQFLWSGVGLVVIMTVVMQAYFNRAITRRLSLVEDNALRIVSEKPLRPIAPNDTDEIAHLDRILHDVALALQDAAQRERAIVDNAVDVICSIDANNRFLSVSPASLLAWGYMPEELIGVRVANILYADDLEPTLQTIKSIVDKQQVSSFESRVLCKDSSIINVLWSASWSASQQSLFCVAHDITERKQIEEKIRRIIDDMPIGLFVINDKATIELTNPASESMFELTGDEMKNRSLAHLLARPGIKSTEDEIVQFILQQPIRQAIELQGLRKNGTTFPVEFSLSELQIAGERRLLATIVDITERHAVERMRREFVAMISHDLRTPLSSLIGNLALINSGQLGKLSDRGMAIAKTSEKQASRLILLVNELLDIARMEAGKFDIDPRMVMLERIIEQSVQSVSQLAAEHKISIALPVCKTMIYADEQRLGQVIMNLLSNAIKFSPADSIIEIAVEENEEWIQLSVIDKGRGIPATYKNLIFERFAQVQSGDARNKGGTGLGLAICKMIVEGHNGTIGVESEEGKGSTFWFRIPRLTG